MVEGVELGEDQVYGFRETEAAHIGAENFDGSPGAAGFLAGEAAHVGGKVHGIDFLAGPGKFNGGGAGAAAEVADSAGARKSLAENLAAGVAIHLAGVVADQAVVVAGQD
jgi:hypothetical protein